jgi:hypothetical protein
MCGRWLTCHGASTPLPIVCASAAYSVTTRDVIAASSPSGWLVSPSPGRVERSARLGDCSATTILTGDDSQVGRRFQPAGSPSTRNMLAAAGR